jgi:hypothetical protein
MNMGRRFLARANAAIDGLVWKPIDARIYAALRIAFAAVSLLNLIDLWPHRHAFFSPDGMIDLAEVKEAVGSQPYYSVFNYVTSDAGTTAVFLGAAAAIIALGAGCFSRVAAVLVYVWYLSYNYRAFPVLHGWDRLMLITGFVLMMAPIGHAWSVDAWRRRRAGRPVTAAVPIYGLNVLRFQLFVMYLDTVWLKVDDQYWRSGEFTSYFMLSVYSRFRWPVMADLQMLSAMFTYGTLAAELSVAWLLLFKRTRVWGFIVGCGLHIGIAVTADILIFSLATMLLYLAFLDDDDIERIAGWARRRFRASA